MHREEVKIQTGTEETKTIQTITKEVIKGKIIGELLPVISNKWPHFGCKCMWIQQDNARPHIQANDAQFMKEAKQEGFDIHIICQPPKSPDLNALDLGLLEQFNLFNTMISQLQ